MEEIIDISDINENPIQTGTGSLIFAFKSSDKYIIKAVKHDINKNNGKVLHTLAC